MSPIKKKIVGVIVIIIAVVFLLIFVTILANALDKTKKWDRYNDIEYGITFKYPEFLEIKKELQFSPEQDILVPFYSISVKEGQKNYVREKCGYSPEGFAKVTWIKNNIKAEDYSNIKENPFQIIFTNLEGKGCKFDFNLGEEIQNSVEYVAFNSKVLQKPEIYQPSSLNINDWETCKNDTLGIEFKHPKELKCHENVNPNNSNISISLDFPEFKTNPFLLYLNVIFEIENYDSLDKETYIPESVVDENDNINNKVTIRDVVDEISKNQNMKLGIYPAKYESNHGPWGNSKQTTVYKLVVSGPKKILRINMENRTNWDTPAGERINLEYEKLFKEIISTVKFY